MASGIEVAGLALAVLPRLVNQLDDYVLGIEKIWRLKRYRREFAHYSTLFGTQHTISSMDLTHVTNLNLLKQLQTEVDAFWATDKAKELMEQKAIMGKKYQEELTTFLSLRAKERKQRAMQEGASQGPTLPRADRARRPPSYYSNIEYDRAGRPKPAAPVILNPASKLLENQRTRRHGPQ
ncbi:SNF2-like protein [Penicillium solitum]|uniref:SNF2-like protein n=1 Tax=Penicillium solitum TaxID=60172 RepID=UPI001849404D|nr:hypothetical protein HAV15_001019 [Penicillium sp. str. \